MVSETHRRFLADGGNQHVVNGALDPAAIACGSSNGQSYNCNGKSGQTRGGRQCGLHVYRCG
ncbi:hypothetical protein MUK42_06200 [Musa troglodytarum]|uniref:Uncharacterized protein n=1 Tax=Musa troglodytarum TaxID=320322 RepID=A0A9E7HAE1_9LILI|nr:hypothetical protein MUK42_06200 [Musa troglodytarum]